uniref:Reverse transcriptase domain-containing protein n=1 Tax=Oreochromis niloticus TaxID=8128 RepID=A0A669EB57_ORENI
MILRVPCGVYAAKLRGNGRKIISRYPLILCVLEFQIAAKRAKAAFFSDIIVTNGHNPRLLFKIFSSVVNPCPDMPMVPSSALCEQFLKYFTDKILSLKSSLPPVVSPALTGECASTLHQFEPVSLCSLKQIVKQLKMTSSAYEPLPPRIVKDGFDVTGPSILFLMNLSLSSGCVPSVFKHAIVQPVLKKRCLDHCDFVNYRPISKLPFLSKILEKIVLLQLQAYLDAHDICDKFQPRHSTETALLRVLNDLLLITDSGHSAVLVLLDLSSAFDMVDHNILLTRLECTVGIRGEALNWFKSYLLNRSFSVTLGTYSSPTASLCCGVPQGSVLGPMLFSLYMLPLGLIFEKYNISYHLYADDIQIYFQLHDDDIAPSLHCFLECMREVREWLSDNSLILNEKKTEIVVFGNHIPRGLLADTFGSFATSFSDSVSDLGVLLDSSFKFNKQVSSVIKSSFYQLAPYC